MNAFHDDLSTPRFRFSVLGEDKAWEVREHLVVFEGAVDSQEFVTSPYFA